MIPFQERKKLRKILYSKVSLAVLLVILFAVGQGLWRIQEKVSVARAERDLAARSFADLQSRTEELQASLARLKSDSGIEEEVRQKFTVARPGEEVVVVVDESAKKGKNGEATEARSFWERIQSFFVGE
ncbi:MAG: septum formation initiator family protein [Patescibacteria group bacterium]